jgi:hypothetical protein
LKKVRAWEGQQPTVPFFNVVDQGWRHGDHAPAAAEATQR